MAYVKHWADNPKLNKKELKKLKKDGLEILKDNVTTKIKK